MSRSAAHRSAAFPLPPPALLVPLALLLSTVLVLTAADDTDPVDRMPSSAAGDTGDLPVTVATGLDRFWRFRFPARFGRPWPELGGFRAVDPADPAGRPICGRAPAALAGQALYCRGRDLVAWDRVGLMPRLRHRYGPGAVLVALAHEFGHAVTARLGLDPVGRPPDRYRSALVEGMADCFAGVAARAAAEGAVPGIGLRRGQLDSAAHALLELRDPVGIRPGPDAHGTSFDRLSAFLDGWDGDAGACAGMPGHFRPGTGRGYSTLAEAASRGELPLPAVRPRLLPAARAWFATLGPPTGAGPSSVPPEAAPASPPEAELSRVYRRYGDYAVAELIVTRDVMARREPLPGAQLSPREPPSSSEPSSSEPSSRSSAAICLSGAFTRALFDGAGDRDLRLSPGDVDEAVALLLDRDVVDAEPAVAGAPGDRDPGLARVGWFRLGMERGPGACGTRAGRR